MNKRFFHNLRCALSLPLPGEQAQFIMAPASRIRIKNTTKISEAAKQSAVLVLLYPKDNTLYIPLILRNEYAGVHSGQVGFPGGKKDKNDPTLEITALREAEEELNIDSLAIEVLGKLTQLYIPPSNFIVTPFVAVSNTRPDFILDKLEVQQLIELPTEDLLNDNMVKETVIHLQNNTLLTDTPYFDINNHVVWGATAMILSELKEVLKSFAT